MSDKVNNPSHYNAYSVETIEMMVRVFGAEEVAIFCEINAFKYRMRMGLKDDINQDFKKEQWYLKMMDIMRDRVRVNEKTQPYGVGSNL